MRGHRGGGPAPDVRQVFLDRWPGLKLHHLANPDHVQGDDQGEIMNPGQHAAFRSVPCLVFQIDVRTDTKTKDNVTLTVTTAIQCCVDPERAHDYYFKLSSPQQQVASYVQDCIRSLLPTLDLDRAFESKDAMAQNIKETVAKAMEQYDIVLRSQKRGGDTKLKILTKTFAGLNVVSALVVDMNVDPSVLRAMNEINAARRQREATIERAEAEKILVSTSLPLWCVVC
eukprot:1936173-Rhodomonas_salina.2